MVAFRREDAGGFVMFDTFNGQGQIQDCRIQTVRSDLTGTVAHCEGVFLPVHQVHKILVQVCGDRVTASVNGVEQYPYSPARNRFGRLARPALAASRNESV